jgi:site-specific recombinase XerD
MKNLPMSLPPGLEKDERPDGFPGEAELAALRGWYAGLSSRKSVGRYLETQKVSGQSSRGMIGNIRRQLISIARQRHRFDLVALLDHPISERAQHARAVAHAIDTLRRAPEPVPRITDDVGLWLPDRSANALYSQDIKTLTQLTLRVPRRRRWWTVVPGLGAKGARQIEAFFAAHPHLTDRARELVVAERTQTIVPWERLEVPDELNGTRGSFRGPRSSCTLSAENDYEAVQAWLALHESIATKRAYRKEAERLILWAVLERGRALSSLTTEDATAYRGFLRNPTPRSRWVGPPQTRFSANWRPFAAGLSPRSTAYSLTVIGAMFSWLIEQRYLVANPFSGIKVRGSSRSTPMDEGRVFSEGEWGIIRAVANGLEWSYGWKLAAAQRLRFVLDFAYATGLRSSEFVGATLGQIETDAQGDHWLKVVGKGSKAGKVALPPLARVALDHYLMQRGVPTTPAMWKPSTPLIADLQASNGQDRITSTRLWNVTKRFFVTTAEAIEAESPKTAEKLRRASPHWMRHTHATHALARGAELTTVRDNLRHASVSTTSVYLHTDQAKRARQMREAFGTSNA